MKHRQHFVQIQSNCSPFLTAKYRVPKGSILSPPKGSVLSPALFNLCVADMSSIALNSNCIQYANNSTLCRSCKINKKDTCIKESKKILPQLQNSQLNLISYLTLVKQNLCLSHQINCRHNINLTMNDYRFAAITPNRKRNKMEATWFNY